MMMYAKFMSLDELRVRQTLRKNKIRWNKKQRIHEGGEMATKKKTNNFEYHRNLMHFVDVLAEHQAKGLDDAGEAADTMVGVTFETGRRYDKIVINFASKSSSRMDQEVRYYVEKETGTIYGAKSPTAPNTRHYFGNVADVDYWDWSGVYGVPLDLDEDGYSEKAKVQQVGAYGDYPHFEKANAKPKKTAGATS